MNNFENFYLNIKMIDSTVKRPTRAYEGDAGIDVYSAMDYIIPPYGDVLISLGFKVEFPSGYVMIFKEKSGRAIKNKLSVGACVVDSGYRNIVLTHVFNHSNQKVVINKNEKITQFIITPVWSGQPNFVNVIDEDTERGLGGFGSSKL